MIEASTALVDETAFNEAQNFMNSKFIKIIGYYFEDTATYIDMINQGIATQDVSVIIPAAHTIKSSSKQLGAEKLSLAAARLEEAARMCLKGEQPAFQVFVMAGTIQPIFVQTVDKIKEIIANQK